MEREILVIDAGTTSTRAIRFAPDGACLGQHSAPIAQHYPCPGWVEHDANEIRDASFACARQMIDAAGGSDRIAAIGIANQRETVVFWDRSTGEALAPAIVWQDRRSADLCAALIDRGEEAGVQARSGLLLDPYFSGTKIAWALEHWTHLREAGDRLAIGTVESWLMWHLTGGAHVSDATNASRTLLMALGSGSWDDGLIDLFGVPRAALPEIVDCAGQFGTTSRFGGSIAITGMAGDQQAATIGQSCLARGETKATYGTGAFVLANCGTTPPVSRNRLLATVAWQIGGRRTYALEGSVFVAGSLIQWLRDSLGLLASADESEALARSVADNGGVYCVPALAGIGAPWWRPEARAAITGMSFATTRAHVARAALEAMAHQTRDLKTAFAADGADWKTLRIDGGMVANDWMAQDLADMLDIPVERPGFAETTALGAAMLAGVGAGIFATLEDAAAMRGPIEHFLPTIADSERTRRVEGWSAAVQAVVVKR
ncbi:FGGY family carbohydrate kinase [Sphingomonas japonica]|uniref:Glycerol kinase n=1 Tax=Sphingomonas japonica TaxID=511662 RepID=A0ABX0U373_9SPHN|nr:glycerol kinase [Sphingomonas japonica]NIJ24939.1 glycerol kinase [Sphingomonas japonica]